MPRPVSKEELLVAIDAGRLQLTAVLRELGPRRQQAPFDFAHRDCCVRDVLGHLAGWQALFLTWYKQGMAGDDPQMPAPGFTWQTTAALNAKLLSDCQPLTLPQVRRRLSDRHRRIRGIVVQHSDEQLFTRRLYPWTGSTSLGSYVVSATSAHYHWAVRLLNRHLKQAASSIDGRAPRR